MTHCIVLPSQQQVVRILRSQSVHASVYASEPPKETIQHTSCPLFRQRFADLSNRTIYGKVSF